MKRELGLALVLAASALSSQSIQTVATTASDDTPLFDERGDQTWVVTPDWKAGFTQGGATFVPFLGADAPRNWPLTMRLAGVLVAGSALELGSATPTRSAMHIAFAHGGVIEDYEVQPEGLEQSFRIEHLPMRGALRLELAFTTDLAPRLVDGEIHFDGPAGGVRYGRAFAIDADGARCAVETQLAEDRITLVVPADFVARAALPLTIDPLIGSTTSVATVSRVSKSVDVAWSESLSRYAVCYERVWSATDSDVFVRILDSDMQLVGNALVVDGSTTSWSKCSIASTEAVAQQLVVAEVSSAGSSPFSIYGRMVVHLPNLALNAPFPIAGPAFRLGDSDATNPDVGGDPATGPTYFGVVWESRTGLLDSDILFNQVTATGAVRFTNHITIDDARPITVEPRISKSDGQAPFSTQCWAIVYREIAAQLNHTSLRAAVVSWNGVPRDFGGSTSFEIDHWDSYFESDWDVSSPTDDRSGTRKFMVAASDSRFAHPFIVGKVFDRDGTVLTIPTVLVNAGIAPWTPVRPSIDTDGCRFTLGYVRSSPTNNDVAIQTIIDEGAVIALQDQADLSTTPLHEDHVALVARHSGGGPRLDYGVAWSREIGSGNSVIEAVRYQGRIPGDIAARSTGCGTVTISTTGAPALGAHFEVHAGGTGSVFGLLAGLPMDAAVPGCNGCRLGVSGGAYTATTMAFDIPCTYQMLGGVVSFQAFAVGGGSCLGSLGLSDTIDVTIR